MGCCRSAPTRSLTAAVNPAGRLSASVTLEGPSRWSWPALDLLGVRWFVTAGLPPDQIRVLEINGFKVAQRDAWFLLWERPAPPLARMVYDVDTVADPADRVARLEAGTRCWSGPLSSSR